MEQDHLSFDEFDELDYPGLETTDFETLADKAMSRRGFLGGGAAFGLSAFVLGTTAPAAPARASSRLDFTAVPTNTLDMVTVPQGYSWQIVAKWGQPLWSDSQEFDGASRGTGASQERAFGDNNDGMGLFADGDRHVLAVNNEYTNRSIIFVSKTF